VDALLRRFAADVDFDVADDRVRGVAVDFRDQALRVERMQAIDVCDDLENFVALQMTDEVPLGLESGLGRRFRLRYELLRAVLADRNEPGVECLAYDLERVGLGDTDQRDVGGVAVVIGRGYGASWFARQRPRSRAR